MRRRHFTQVSMDRVSNHGGRQEETLRVDHRSASGIVAPWTANTGVDRPAHSPRYDIFKALALGATAVGIRAPQAWGVAAFGQPASRPSATY